MVESSRESQGSTVPSRLGFGGSNLLGDKTPSQGLALLEAAYAEGIRHFDVAPAYGYGDAEALVGEFARDKRDKITIATKFGLEPMKPVSGAKGLVSVVRKIMRTSPWVRGLVRRNAGSLMRRRRFDVNSAQLSLEKSLRALRTDVIDIYLLHECEPPDCSKELLDFLQEAVSAGKIRHFGIGTEFSHAQSICSCCPEFSPVVQLKSSIVEPNLSVLLAQGAKLRCGTGKFITHGSLTAIPVLRHRLKTDAAWAERWNQRLGLDLRDEEVVAGLILQHALRANGKGIVLFQSASLSRVVTNIRAASAPMFTATQLDDFGRLGAELSEKSPSN